MTRQEIIKRFDGAPTQLAVSVLEDKISAINQRIDESIKEHEAAIRDLKVDRSAKTLNARRQLNKLLVKLDMEQDLIADQLDLDFPDWRSVLDE